MWALFFWKEFERKKGINTMSMNTININDFRETDYDGYLVNADGDVISMKHEEPILLSPFLRHGYERVTLWENGKKFNVSVHRLVAMAFIDNPDPNTYTEINHKDENKTNNNVNNLEWCTHLYNLNYGTRNLKHSIAMKKYWKQRKAV